MTTVLPRLAKEDARGILERYSDSGLDVIGESMPIVHESLTYSAVGGAPLGDPQLRALRSELLTLAREHGMPNQLSRQGVAAFEGQAAEIIHRSLPITPHEAAHEEVWSYLTCCWLLDVAVWRFGMDADERRFIGNVNRNTFRRLWWRVEVLGAETDLTRLGEDELVNIMERPTISSDRRLAKLIAAEFLLRVDRDEAAERMQLMREAMKRFLRLTPFVSFSALDDKALESTVSGTFDDAAASLVGLALGAGTKPLATSSAPSPDVYKLDRVTIGESDSAASSSMASALDESSFVDIAQAALAIARRTGRVTNATLREAVPVTSEDARRVLKTLTAQGILENRGARRGSHYVVVESDPVLTDSGVESMPGVDTSGEASALSHEIPDTDRKPVDDALRRLLRRRR
ncbi:DUF6339 family protein [Kribbella sp. VKM Ac-2568]|uniref:DUF6339 family protein n=1 Tax=Kribbella sp. VKM Ac-2568 TaxID=2512219 RepID=UPI001051C95C|nr:DUF6339 family protein [Kribbella sp. VKM Ac-2568]TCM39645.1 hypothetical protein EV648_114167 [Kribbella sp. VKM Ac-2568]